MNTEPPVRPDILPFALIGVDLHHDGLMLKTAFDVASGQKLFRETFTQNGTLTTDTHAWSLHFLGPSLLSLKQVTVGAYAVAAAFLAAAWGFQSVCLYTLIRGLKDATKDKSAPREVIGPFFTGLSAALIFWSRTPVGIFLFAALCVIYLLFSKSKIKTGIAFLMGNALIYSVFVAEVVRNQAVQDWLNQTFIWPRRWAQSLGMGPLRILEGLFLEEISQRVQGRVVFQRWGSLIGMTLLFGALLFHARKYPEKRSAWFYRRVAALFACMVVLNFACIDVITPVRPLSFLIPVSVLVFFLVDSVAWFRSKTSSGTALISAVSLFCFASWLQPPYDYAVILTLHEDVGVLLAPR